MSFTTWNYCNKIPIPKIFSHKTRHYFIVTFVCVFISMIIQFRASLFVSNSFPIKQHCPLRIQPAAAVSHCLWHHLRHWAMPSNSSANHVGGAKCLPAPVLLPPKRSLEPPPSNGIGEGGGTDSLAPNCSNRRHTVWFVGRQWVILRILQIQILAKTHSNQQNQKLFQTNRQNLLWAEEEEILPHNNNNNFTIIVPTATFDSLRIIYWGVIYEWRTLHLAHIQRPWKHKVWKWWQQQQVSVYVRTELPWSSAQCGPLVTAIALCTVPISRLLLQLNFDKHFNIWEVL